MHNAATINELIDRDLRDHPDFFNSHGVVLKTCRVAPTRLTCTDPANGDALVEVWLVLREVPGTESGYLMVFDPGSGLFGLAEAGQSQPVLIGLYGSFTETLAGR